MADQESTRCNQMEVDAEAVIAADKAPCSHLVGNASKREREDDELELNVEKKAKLPAEGEAAAESSSVSVGPKTFTSSVDMFDYFRILLHTWPPKVDLNKYEHMVLLELLKKGHLEPDKKIGTGVNVFQVRFHPQYKSRCFFLVRNDGSADDFSFRKCVDRILPLPEKMKIMDDVNEALRGKGSGRGRGRGPGRGHPRK